MGFGGRAKRGAHDTPIATQPRGRSRPSGFIRRAKKRGPAEAWRRTTEEGVKPLVDQTEVHCRTHGRHGSACISNTYEAGRGSHCRDFPRTVLHQLRRSGRSQERGHHRWSHQGARRHIAIGIAVATVNRSLGVLRAAINWGRGSTTLRCLRPPDSVRPEGPARADAEATRGPNHPSIEQCRRTSMPSSVTKWK